jgi:hypothetical protein
LGITIPYRLDSERWILAQAPAASHLRCHAAEFRSAAPVAVKHGGKSAITSIGRWRYSIVCGLNVISDDVLRRIQRDIDLAEARLRHHQ